ncbi:MAG: bifunctional (p)ppGpp synthetase/guanosine-3',5'-bis(diphosphate) 3'-pyrophosphohydrolase [Gallionella sp.]|nr:bifunctional (p)ppGpp synthetase/guanosine-3',5'-bis(diphosphate) 3'-pyrophosphohydrolase [Gallionella sp.]
MVSNQQQSSENTRSWLDALASTFAPAEVEVIRRACELAGPLYEGQIELTGAPLMQHALGAADILAGMRMDHETIAATILHAVPEYLDDWAERLEKDFGSQVKMLVEGISRMEQIQQFSEIPSQNKKKKDEAAQQIESLRKMLLAMVQDIRVVLIKLAERTQTMRNLSGAKPEQQKQIAQETRSLFAPLANRLGVWQLKWELEDLSVRYLEPELYKKVAKLLDERRVDREQYIAGVLTQLKQVLGQAGVKAEVTGRPKHIYSIINKMKRKQLDFSELYDVRALRILVEDIKGCYTALGLVHDLWPPIDGEFDDYIAHPKSNNYRSLHTAVIGPRGLPLEVQIRTHEMHQHSELGVAAHWRYKEGGKSQNKSEPGFDEKIAWLRQILEWKEDLAGKGDMQEQFRNELFHDQVYVLTPQGKVIDLPKGATPVDFAYTLHTGLGHRTRGAKVDGSIVPLNYKLQNGQRVEILTIKQGAPSRDWINPSLGFLQSSRARAKVRAWFKDQNFDESVAQGRTQLDRELHRLGIITINQEKLAQRLHFNKLEDLLAAIGRNEITPHRIAVAIQEELPAKVIEIAKPKIFMPATQRTAKADITVGGVNNLMTRIAKCCNPAPGDDIVGYVTRDRGITIHRKDCAFMMHMMESRRDRKLTAQWGT